MSHIVIDARQLRSSSGRYIERLLHYLQQTDTEHRYSVLVTSKDIDGWTLTNPRFTKVRCDHKEFTFAEQIGLLRQIRSLKPDLVHFAFAQQPILYRGKKVTTIHDLTTLRFHNPSKQRLVFAFKQKVYYWVNYIAAHSSAFVFTPSEFVKQDVMQTLRMSGKNVRVTYESADSITDDSQPVSSVAGKRFIMYVGRPTPHKNLPRLIEAFRTIQAEHPDLYLVLAGKKDKNYEQIANLVQNEQIANIIFTDFISDGQLRWLYEHTSAYVFPTLSEGFGLPGLEAMHYNAPVVSSNATCLPEIYKNAALYFNPVNITDMAIKITEVVTDEAAAQQLVKNGHDLLKTYSWHKMASETLALYNQALNTKTAQKQ